MKVLKRILIILSSVLTLLAIVILVLFWINDSQLEYLSYQNEGRSYLIRHANIIPMDRDTILRNHDLLIQDGRIERIGKELESNGIPVVETNGAYLLPGLIDMHVHLWDRYELGLYLRHGVTSIRNLWGQPFHLRVKDELVKGKILGPNLFTSGPKLSGPSNSTPDNKPVLTAEEARKLLKDYKARGYDFIKTYNGMTESVF
ncbi:MAG: amidohydrolase, partial [Bacteroidota bacterium]|nr:amidohydrolase [Bacteroidota bacterium]